MHSVRGSYSELLLNNIDIAQRQSHTQHDVQHPVQRALCCIKTRPACHWLQQSTCQAQLCPCLRPESNPLRLAWRPRNTLGGLTNFIVDATHMVNWRLHRTCHTCAAANNRCQEALPQCDKLKARKKPVQQEAKQEADICSLQAPSSTVSPNDWHSALCHTLRGVGMASIVLLETSSPPSKSTETVQPVNQQYKRQSAHASGPIRPSLVT